MKNVDENFNKRMIGRHYFYKGHEYEVKDIVMIELKDNVDENYSVGVLYKNVDFDRCGLCTREINDFLINFVPLELEVGDMVNAVSMNRSRGLMKVSEITNDPEFCVKFANQDILAKKHIDPLTLEIEVDLPEQATDYIFVKPAKNLQIPFNKIIRTIRSWEDILNINSDFDDKIRVEICKKINKIKEIIES